MKTILKPQLVSKAEYDALMKLHQQKDSLLQYEEWRNVADRVQAYLETVGVEYNCRTEKGDFIVGADWWEDRCIDMNFQSQNMLSKSVLQGLFDLVAKLKDAWTLNISGAHDSTPIFYDVLICKDGIYVSIDESLTDMKSLEVRPWISQLQGICK